MGMDTAVFEGKFIISSYNITLETTNWNIQKIIRISRHLRSLYALTSVGRLVKNYDLFFGMWVVALATHLLNRFLLKAVAETKFLGDK